MSWLNKLLPPRINENNQKSNVPEGLWCKCDHCNEILYSTDFNNNCKVCVKCNHHHTLSARERIELLLDADAINIDNIQSSRVEIAKNLQTVDILKFVDSKKYSDRLELARQTLEENDALVVMYGQMNTVPVVLACFEFKFIGGSMSSAVGEKFVQGVQYALKHKCPFICVSASGGARMQEGVTALMQMAKTTAVLQLLTMNKLPFISILTNPTMGGVSASFAFLGDVVIAEPNALIGFAGARVILQTVHEKLPNGFQRAEFLLEKGSIDMIVKRKELKATITTIIKILMLS